MCCAWLPVLAAGQSVARPAQPAASRSFAALRILASGSRAELTMVQPSIPGGFLRRSCFAKSRSRPLTALPICRDRLGLLECGVWGEHPIAPARFSVIISRIVKPKDFSKLRSQPAPSGRRRLRTAAKPDSSKKPSILQSRISRTPSRMVSFCPQVMLPKLGRNQMLCANRMVFSPLRRCSPDCFSFCTARLRPAPRPFRRGAWGARLGSACLPPRRTCTSATPFSTVSACSTVCPGIRPRAMRPTLSLRSRRPMGPFIPSR